MDKRKRYQLLLDRKMRYENRLLGAQKRMGEGSWHEDSSYELADQDIRLYKTYLEELTIEIKKLEKELGIEKKK